MVASRSLTRVFAAFVIALGVTGTVLLLLSGCTVSASFEVPRSDIAASAADALEQQVGIRPDVDCAAGDNSPIPLADGAEVDCVLSVDGDPERYAAVATIEVVDLEAGTYRVDVQVAEEPLP